MNEKDVDKQCDELYDDISECLNGKKASLAMAVLCRVMHDIIRQAGQNPASMVHMIQNSFEMMSPGGSIN